MRAGELVAERFEIERFVARGGMGAVYRAIDRITNRPVALKLFAADPEFARRLSLEARALLELDHPAIVRYVAHATDPEHRALYLAMEWLEGETLSAHLRRRSLSVAETLTLGIRVAEGLGAIHAHDMVHRDIKPLNIFLPRGAIPRVKILDFGTVRLHRWQRITLTGTGMGTPEYMSPEQARCEREITPSADIFALGCVLYKCLTRQNPFQGSRVEAVLAKIAMVADPPRVSDLLPEVAPLVDEIIAEMMAHDAAARPAHGAAAAARLRDVQKLLQLGARRVRSERIERKNGQRPDTAAEGRGDGARPGALTERELQPLAVIIARLSAELSGAVPLEIFHRQAAPRRWLPPEPPPELDAAAAGIVAAQMPADELIDELGEIGWRFACGSGSEPSLPLPEPFEAWALYEQLEDGDELSEELASGGGRCAEPGQEPMSRRTPTLPGLRPPAPTGGEAVAAAPPRSACDLDEVELVDAGLEDQELEDSELEAAQLELEDSGLEDAALEGAELEDSGLEGAELEDSGLEDAGLDDGAFQVAELDDDDPADGNAGTPVPDHSESFASYRGPAATERVHFFRGHAHATRLLPEVRRIATPFGGRAEVLLDGSFVVLFSGGSAATDLAARSARCALAMRQILPDAAVGLATQRAVMNERAAIGPVIDSAAALVRLGGAAVHLDKNTADLLPARFHISGDPQLGLTLCGDRGPAEPLDEPPRLLFGKPTPCVGRNALLGQLEAIVAGCIEERVADAVAIVGAAGVGKSRLRAELVRRLRARYPELRFVGACGDPMRTHVPFGVVTRALLECLGLADPALAGAASPVLRKALLARVTAAVGDTEATRVAQFLGELIGLPWEETAATPAVRAARRDPELMADHQRRAVEEFFTAEASAAPLLVVMDDLHWADPPSVELFAAAVRAARERPLLLLALTRPEVKERFSDRALAWLRQEIRLEALRPAACAELVRATLGDTIDRATAARLVERSAGNPFYLEELIRAAAENPSLETLPDTIVASAQLRLARLPDQARHVLRAASIYGRDFCSAGVTALLGSDAIQANVDEWLALLQREEILDPQTPGQNGCRFRHDLLREAAYAMLTDDDRRTGHRLAGRWLEARGGAEPIILAEHFAGGGAAEDALAWFQRAAEEALSSDDGTGQDRDGAEAHLEALRTAATYFRRAAETAAQSYANSDAIRFFTRAANLWTALDPIEAAQTRLALAEVRERIGERQQALDDLGTAQTELGEQGGSALFARCLLQRARLIMRSTEDGALDRARKLAQQALAFAISDSDPAPAQEAAALHLLAIILNKTEEDSDRALVYAERAVAIQRQLGNVAEGLWRLGNSFVHRHGLDHAERLYAQALAAAEREGDLLLVAHCLSNFGLVAFRRWRLDAAINYSQRARTIYQTVGHRARINENSLNLGTYFQMKGDLGAARALLEEVLVEADDWQTSTFCRGGIADLERHEGNEEAAQGHLAAAASLCKKVGAAQKEALYLGLWAESLWAQGHASRAVACLERAVAVGSGVTLSHALLMGRMGEFDNAIQWLGVLGEKEWLPDRKALIKLSLARLYAWKGCSVEARRGCDKVIELTGPAGLAAQSTPPLTLLACLDGDAEAALAGLTDARTHCGSQVISDVILDVGTLLACASVITNDQRDRYLGLSAGAPDRGVAYRIEYLRAHLFRQQGDLASARRAFDRARAEVEHFLGELEGENRLLFANHPWVRAITSHGALF